MSAPAYNRASPYKMPQTTPNLPKFTAMPVMITGFSGEPDLAAVLSNVHAGLVYVTFRNSLLRRVDINFAQQSAAEKFVLQHKTSPLVVNGVQLSVAFDLSRRALPIPHETAVEIFNRGTTRVLGISMTHNPTNPAPVKEEDILALHDHPDPKGGVIRLSKTVIDNAKDGVAREYWGVEYFSVEACLSVRQKLLSSWRSKFAGCVPLRLVDPCGGLEVGTVSTPSGLAQPRAPATAPEVRTAKTAGPPAQSPSSKHAVRNLMDEDVTVPPSNFPAPPATLPVAPTQPKYTGGDLIDFGADEKQDHLKGKGKAKISSTGLEASMGRLSVSSGSHAQGESPKRVSGTSMGSAQHKSSSWLPNPPIVGFSYQPATSTASVRDLLGDPVPANLQSFPAMAVTKPSAGSVEGTTVDTMATPSTQTKPAPGQAPAPDSKFKSGGMARSRHAPKE